MKVFHVKPPKQGKEPWERLESEPVRHFGWFVLYRDQGPMRSLAEAARQAGLFNRKRLDAKGQPMPNPTPLRRVMEKWKWEDRVAAYDQMIDKLKVQKAKDEAEKMVERHLSIAGTIQGRAYKRLREMDDAELLAKMGPRTILQYLKEGIEIERKTRGQPTSIVKNESQPAGASDEDVESEAMAAAKDILLRKLNDLAKRKEGGQKATSHLQNNRLANLEIIADTQN